METKVTEMEAKIAEMEGKLYHMEQENARLQYDNDSMSIKMGEDKEAETARLEAINKAEEDSFCDSVEHILEMIYERNGNNLEYYDEELEESDSEDASSNAEI